MSKCETCLHKSLHDMITSGKSYGYGGPIPCFNCSSYVKFIDRYEPTGIAKPECVRCLGWTAVDADRLGYKYCPGCGREIPR